MKWINQKLKQFFNIYYIYKTANWKLAIETLKLLIGAYTITIFKILQIFIKYLTLYEFLSLINYLFYDNLTEYLIKSIYLLFKYITGLILL